VDPEAQQSGWDCQGKPYPDLVSAAQPLVSVEEGHCENGLETQQGLAGMIDILVPR
jgi:hypothetical protein